MPDFWRSCGYRLLSVAGDGRLRLTDGFLRSTLLQPQLAPIAASCLAEFALHDKLFATPCAAVATTEIDAIADEPARESYRAWLRYRDRLAAVPSLEAAYLALFAEGADLPPPYIHQLTQIMVRHILGSEADPLEARAGELLFRAQKIALRDDGAVMAADDATVALDVLDRSNGHAYWQRDERFDLAIDLRHGQPALAAFCRVLQRWVAHFLAIGVTVVPQRETDDRRWAWHVGLDAEASSLLNDLYNRVEVDEARKRRLLSLFELRFDDPAAMRAAIADRAVYLAMAMDAHARLKLKPQNLLVNLPLARPQ